MCLCWCCVLAVFACGFVVWVTGRYFGSQLVAPADSLSLGLLAPELGIEVTRAVAGSHRVCGCGTGLVTLTAEHRWLLPWWLGCSRQWHWLTELRFLLGVCVGVVVVVGSWCCVLLQTSVCVPRCCECC